MGQPKTSSLTSGPYKQPMDKLLLILTITLIGFGIVCVFDASYAAEIRKTNHSEYSFVFKQIRCAILGLGALFFATLFPYWKWKDKAIVVISIITVLLFAVYIPGIGHTINGARRWVGFGSLLIQPSEFAKLAIIIYLAKMASVRGSKLRNLKSGLMPPLLVILLLCGLVAHEPDLGTAIVMCGTAVIMLFVAGARRRHMLTLCSLLPIAMLIYTIVKPYRIHRWDIFRNPESNQYGHGYQVWHSLIAIGSGGLAGRSLGEGIEKIFLPMAPTDFIMAVIGEEWGLFGTLIVVGLFFLVALRGFSISHRTKDVFGAMLATGITSMICLQSVINIAVATASIPNTGVPLPFISYGGSALIMLMTSIGILLNVSRHPEGSDDPDDRPDVVKPNERDFERRWNNHPYVPRSTSPGYSTSSFIRYDNTSSNHYNSRN